MFTYTVAVKSKFSLHWTKYEVVGHTLNTEIPGSTRLALSLPDGSAIIIPEFDKKYFMLFKDYHVRNEYVKRLNAQQQPQAVAHAQIKEDYHGSTELPES